MERKSEFCVSKMEVKGENIFTKLYKLNICDIDLFVTINHDPGLVETT